MLFDIDLKPRNSLAAIDEVGNSVTYGELSDFSNQFKNLIPERELIFCLCENTIGALLGFISFYENKDVALLLGSTTDRELLFNLISVYKPSFIWLPKKYINEFQVEIVYQNYGYVLGSTGYKAYPMNQYLSLLLTTSGSTGSPKLVRYKYGNIEANAKTVANVFEWTTEERAICELPMQYSMGLNVINSHLYSGGTILMISSSLTSLSFWKFIKEHKGTSFTGVPFSYDILLKLRFVQMDLPHLKTIAEGGGKLTDSIFSTLADWAEKNGKRFFATFGTTETSARMSYLPPHLATLKCGSIGQAIPGSEMLLLDDNGNLIEGNDVEGELCYRGSNVTMGYAICKEDLLRDDDFSGEYKTGDLAKRDSDGFYYIVGRKKRFLKLFGFRVSLDQCERLINEKFNIECACIGDDSTMNIYITNEMLQVEVKNYISLKTKLLPAAFNIRVIDKIPRNNSGKISYTLLK